MKKADIKRLAIDQFDYPLPDEKIAKYPLPDRDSSKLLIYDNGCITSTTFNLLTEQLPFGSLLLFNNTRVIHARLIFHKATGARIELFCLSPYDPIDYAVNFQQRRCCSWRCMVGNARRWKNEVLSLQVPIGERMVELCAKRAGMDGGDAIVTFYWDDSGLTFSELLDVAGKLPIPPYLNRSAEKSDDYTYQTVYSQVEGSVAAPTAGLHFTSGLMDRISNKGIRVAEVTLHVGAGTFKPIKSPSIGSHSMHTEFISVPRETIEKLLNCSGPLIAVGTTSMRTVESLYYIGKKLQDKEMVNELGKVIEIDDKVKEQPDVDHPHFVVEQWEPYDESEPIAPRKALEVILRYLDLTGEASVTATTRLMIAPGYLFHYPDGLITNFHQPRSTLLLLVSAFIGDQWREVYRFALDNEFRFLSYGDSSLLWKNPK